MTVFKSILQSKQFKIVALSFSLLFFFSTFFVKLDESVFNTWGYLGIFIFNIFSSGILLIPKLINIVNPILFIIVSALGMTIGESINWYLGFLSNDFIKENEKEKKLQELLVKYQYYAIFFFALIPFPFDMIGTFSGRLNIPFNKYILTILSARILRFAILIYTFDFFIR